MAIWVQLQLQYQHGWPVCILGSMYYRGMKEKHFLRILLRKEFKTLRPNNPTAIWFRKRRWPWVVRHADSWTVISLKDLGAGAN